MPDSTQRPDASARTEPSLPTERDASVDYLHIGPGTLAGRYLRRFWHPIAESASLVPGQNLPVRLLGESFALYRGASGTPHLVEPLCPHRRTRLSVGWVEGDSLRCMYHGWRFRPDGVCDEMPAERADTDCSRMRVRTYPVRDYLGLVFAWIGDGEPPELPRYPVLEGPGVRDIYVNQGPYNWFSVVDNMLDPSHTPFTHTGAGFAENGVVGVPKVTGQESSWGIVQYGERPGGGVRVNHFGMPNIFHNRFPPTTPEGGWEALVVWCVPIDDRLHRNFWITLADVHGEAADRYRAVRAERKARLATLPPPETIAQAILDGETTLQAHADRPDLVALQDLVTQMGQGECPDRSLERLVRSDVLVALVRRIYVRELTALRDGRPLKDWAWSDAIVAEVGGSP